MKLIDKDKVVSILQDKIAGIKLDMKCGFLDKRKGTEKILMLKHVISLVDTLEVKDELADGTMLDKLCEWVEDNIWEYIETKGFGDFEILKEVKVSEMVKGLRKAMWGNKL